MKIKITKCSDKYIWYKDHIGEIFEVNGSQSCSYSVKRGCYYDYWVNKDDCVEVFDKAEALKLAINGAKITHSKVNGDYAHVYWNGNDFMFNLGAPGVEEKANGVLKYPEWTLWTPPTPPKPKFLVGDFVVDEIGDYLKVFDLKWNGEKYEYYIACGEYDDTKEKCEVILEEGLRPA